jgi:hypothetical protein
MATAYLISSAHRPWTSSATWRRIHRSSGIEDISEASRHFLLPAASEEIRDGEETDAVGSGTNMGDHGRAQPICNGYSNLKKNSKPEG